MASLSPADRQTLDQSHELTVFGDQYQHLKLWKGSPFESAVQQAYAGRSSTMAAEGLFVIPIAGLTAPDAQKQILKSLTAISTMKGLQVWSNSLKRMETFIFDAYLVGKLDKSDRLTDPDPSTLPNPAMFSFFQKEEQTGESFSQYTVAQTPQWFQVTQTNLSGLKYGWITLVAPHNLLTTIFVVPTPNELLVYGITVAKTPDLFGLERSKNSSLYTRMKALVTWFSGELGYREPAFSTRKDR